MKLRLAAAGLIVLAAAAPAGSARRHTFTFASILGCVAVLLGIGASGANGGSHVPPGRNGAIAFVRKDGLYLINPDGSHLHRIVAGKMLGGPSWSPDGRWIAYSCQSKICVVSSNGRGKRQLIGRRICSPRGSVTRDLYPAWSPDGKRIAFEQHCGVVPGVMAAESAVGLDRAPPGFCAGSFVGLCVMNPRGKRLRVLAKNARGAAWSPNGSRIAFFRNNDLAHSPVIVANARGGRQTQLVRGALNDHADWSPDSRLVAVAPVSGSEEPPFPLILLFPTSSGLPSVLTSDREPQSGRYPSFSPDGKSLVFEPGPEVVPGPGLALWIIGVDGTGLRRLTAPGGDPAWQRLR